MTGHSRSEVAALSRLPPLTVATLAVALFALPLFASATEVLGVGDRPLVRIAFQWVLVAIVLGVAVVGEGVSLAEVGFRRPGWIDVVYVVVLAPAIVAVYALTGPLLEALGVPVQTEAGGVTAGAGAVVLLAGAVTTGVVEEVLYRGYPIERLLAYTDSPLVAGGVTWGAFTVAHAVNWPLGNLLQTALVAAVLTVVYLRRRTLVPVVGAHVLVWVLGVLGRLYG